MLRLSRIVVNWSVQPMRVRRGERRSARVDRKVVISSSRDLRSERGGMTGVEAGVAGGVGEINAVPFSESVSGLPLGASKRLR